MTITEMQERKRELGYTNEMLAQKSGVPLSTVQKILGGKTKSPRMATVHALEKVLSKNSDVSYRYPEPQDFVLRDATSIYAGSFDVNKERLYTIRDIEAMPDDVRAELIDGKIYFMNAPVRIHQEIIVKMLVKIDNYITSHNGSCKVYPAPFGVYLNGETGRDLFEPDLVVICSPDCLHRKGCMGAPDWVMEVISPSTKSRDYAIKLFKYRTAGVKEYWIVNPDKRIVSVYRFGEGEQVEVYDFTEEIYFGIFPDLSVRLSDYV
ncbi:MAG: Uma2 family endonuclease [Blautia sp.]|nr:Uma2 family endonuclease [Blautia sp.]